MKRAVVLGGGGAVGVAWEHGLAAGLLDAGIDLRSADLIVGTSAGSFVGTSLAHGRDPHDAVREIREPAEQPATTGTAMSSFDPAHAAKVFQLWGSFETMTQDACAQVGALALTAPTTTEELWLQGYEAQNWGGWPVTPLVVTAVDCETGALALFDRDSGVSIERAVAASCSVPGLFPPVTINGRRYTDGGVRSFTSADAAARIAPERVLVLSVYGTRGRPSHAQALRQIAEETALLERGGASVRVIHFDEATNAAAGENMMDASRRVPSANAGEALGRRTGTELQAWWHG